MNSAIRSRWLAINFAATIFVSAFLLFQVQPMVSKFILPWFGGTPAVWTTCMLFFQSLLFAGYAYAHFSATWLRPSQQAVVHLLLIVAALLLLQVVPADSWKPTDSLNPVGKILGILAACVGLPFFVLSSTGPLLQSWFARSFPGRTPYRLYALSNFGSLLALLSYPLYFERVFAIGGQKIFWSWGFIAYAAFCGYAAMRLWLDWRAAADDADAEGSGFGVQGSGSGHAALGSAGVLRNSESKSSQKSNVAAAPTAAQFVSDLEITASHLVNTAGTAAELQSEVAGELVHSPPETRPALISSWWRAILWLALPAFASVTLLAATNHVCTDICVMPMLWVVPLALYLLTFIIAFDSPRWYRPVVTATFTIIMIFLVMMIFASGQSHIYVTRPGQPGELLYSSARTGVFGESVKDDAKAISTWRAKHKDDHSNEPRLDVPFALYAGINFAAVFGICLLCHGELVRSRPEPKHLTAFYLMIAAGGALGGLFVSLIAPQIFVTYVEWNIALVVGRSLAMVVLFCALIHSIYAGVPSLQELLAPLRDRFTSAPRRENSIFSLVFAWLTVAGATFVLVDTVLGMQKVRKYLEVQAEKEGDADWKMELQVRNFFGTLTVKSDVDFPDRLYLSHGRITHGFQYTDQARRDIPTTYYSPPSGVGRTVNYYRGQHEQSTRIGAVGLGTGTMAAYVDKGDSIHFYDINPDVIKITTSGKWFTYFKDANERGGKCDVALGDARLSLERELKTGSQRFHVLVLDAFSGDAIPIHLLTVEAVDTYLKQLSTPEAGGEHGALAVHITNRYVDLEPVVIALAEHFQLGRKYISNGDNVSDGAFSSDWIILSRNQELLKELDEFAIPENPAEREPKEKPKKPILWTDAYSNLIDVLK